MAATGATTEIATVPRSRMRNMATAFAGPALIVLAVLVVMRSFAFQGLVTTQHGDILAYWMPFYCFLGKALAAGHLPAFQASTLAGAPFAPDPQSGWLYLPAMLLFTILPCGTAMGWFLVLQPILAGLGASWFLRAEGAGRVASTTAGLVLALVIADSYFALEVPFAGAVAWTAIALAIAARYLRAERWSSRVGWLLALALAWGQIAAAHLSDGLVVGTLALVVYAATRLASDVRSGHRRLREAAALAGLALAAFPLVNLAFLWPRLAYIPETTLGIGYAKLQALSGQLSGHPYVARTYHRSLLGGGSWILGFAAAPGSYLGAAACALAFVGPWSRRHRAVAVALLAFAAACWFLGQYAVADAIGRHLGSLPFVDFYAHAPGRFRYGVVLALPLAAGFGLQAWLEPRSTRDRLLMLVPGLAFWWILPAAVGLRFAYPAIFLVGTVAAAAVLGLVVWRPPLAWLVPGLLLVELVTNGVAGGRAASSNRTAAPWGPLLRPTIDAASYLLPGAIAGAMAASSGVGRYATVSTLGFDKKGRAAQLGPSGWPAVSDQRSMLFGLEDVGGYNPTQPLRYWSFVRMVDHLDLNYNSAYLSDPPSALALDLFQVEWLIAPEAEPPPAADAAPILREGSWELYELSYAPSLASVIGAWQVVGSADAALAAVARSGFDPSAEVVLERDPGIRPATGSSAYATASTAPVGPDGPGAITVTVRTASPEIVLIRNVYDPRWRATVDGKPAAILPADSVDQAVAVPAGHHTIHLTYEDPSIGRGLAASALVIAAFAGSWAWLRRRERSSTGSAVSRAEP